MYPSENRREQPTNNRKEGTEKTKKKKKKTRSHPITVPQTESSKSRLNNRNADLLYRTLKP